MVDVKLVDLEKLGMTKEEFEALDETEQQIRFEEAPLPAPESESEKAMKGLLEDLKAERARRQAAEEKTDELETRIDDLETKLTETAQKRKEEPSADDEDPLTKGEAKKLLKEILAQREKLTTAEFDKKLNAIMSILDADRIKISEDAVKAKFTLEKVGKDLCYDNVIDNGFQKLVDQNPAYKSVVRNSANPALEAYKIGLTHPDFAALAKQQIASTVVDKITTTKVKTAVGSAGGGGGADATKYTLEELIKMDDKELEKLRREN